MGHERPGPGLILPRCNQMGFRLDLDRSCVDRACFMGLGCTPRLRRLLGVFCSSHLGENFHSRSLRMEPLVDSTSAGEPHRHQRLPPADPADPPNLPFSPPPSPSLYT